MLLPPHAERAIRIALDEDLISGDLTSETTLPTRLSVHAVASAKSVLVACGGEVFRRVCQAVDPTLRVELLVEDGVRVTAGSPLWTVSGQAKSVLQAERTALNFTQRMSGVATLASDYVAALAPGSSTRIADTRKTTPGLRWFERYAVRTGGAHNHRDNLGSAVMIKDNHIAACGSISSAVQRAKQRAPHTARIEVEVETLDMLDEALAVGVDIVMLDNFEEESLRQAIVRAKGKALIEVSGGITIDRIRHLSDLGVDIISSGALTHSARAADISLRLSDGHR